MSGLEDWLRTRQPLPPSEVDLRPWLETTGGERVNGDGPVESDEAVERGKRDAGAPRPGDRPLEQRLATAGLAALERAMARTGRVRESAFPLLAADALLTYACEAALEPPDPEATLLRMLEAGFGR